MHRFLRIALATPAAAALAAALGCEPDPAATSFALRLALDDSAEGATCVAAEGPAPSCADFALRCETYVGIRVLEVDDQGQSGDVLSSTCVPASSSGTGTLCDLADLDVSLTQGVELPRRVLRFEVTVWRDDQLNAPGECPFDEVAFDLAGRPRAEPGGTVPAFGRRVELDLSSEDSDARVELACVDPGELADMACMPLNIVARLIDIDTTSAVSSETIRATTVALGVPKPDGADFVIEDSETQPLAPTQAGPLVPTFDITLPRRPEQGSELCILVTESVAQTTTALTCLQVPAPTIETLQAFVYLLRRDVLDALLGAANIAMFPAKGLVVGRAIAADTRQPLADVVVTPSDPQVDVIYIDADLSGVNAEPRTSASGYFLARDVVFGTTWSAVGGGLETAEPARAGVVKNRATVLNLELEPR